MRFRGALATALGCAAAATVCLSPGRAVAQAAPPQPAPPQAAPTREEVDRPELRQDGERHGGRISVEGDIERAPCPLDEPRYREMRVTIETVRFTGLRGISADALLPAYRDLLGPDRPISAICDIRDAAATMLRRQGYLAALQVPPQRIENGVVQLDVLMGRLVSVHVRGDAGRAERTIAGYLQRIQAQDVFNTRDAERYLLLARDIPGYDVRLVLRPAGTAPGELSGELTVERRLMDLDFTLQNHGSRDVGRFGGLLRAQVYGLTGLADRSTLGVYSTSDFREQQVYQLSHDFRLGPEGVSIGGRLAYAETRPEAQLSTSTAPLSARTLLATLEAGFAPLRTQARTLNLAGGLELVDQKLRLGPARLAQDRLRVLFARADFALADARAFGRAPGGEPAWRISGSLEARKGVGAFGASKGCGAGLALCPAGTIAPSRPEGDPRAALVRLSATLDARIVPGLRFALSPRAQYASRPLFAFEEFSAGNYTIGRGYDPGTLSGDSGAGVQAEARLGSLTPAGPDAAALQPFVFVDVARVWNHDRAVAGQRNESLASAGGGLRGVWKGAFADFTLAAPLAHAGASNRRGGVRALLSLTIRMWPWPRD